MRIMTCNVRTARAPDGENRWELRRALCAEVIRSRRRGGLPVAAFSYYHIGDE